MRAAAIFLLLLLMPLGCTLPPSSIRAAGVPNFHRVDARLYRGAQPDASGVASLACLGVKTIINLRMADDTWPDEPRWTWETGIGYVNVPLHGLGRPTETEIARVLTLIDTSPPPVFVHCQHGADRTGTVVACYRIEHDGWTAASAQKEADEHGMAWVQFGMKRFITDFGGRVAHRAPAPAP